MKRMRRIFYTYKNGKLSPQIHIYYAHNFLYRSSGEMCVVHANALSAYVIYFYSYCVLHIKFRQNSLL